MLEKILDYQAKDKQLKLIKTEIGTSDCAKKVAKCKKFLESVDSLASKLDSIAAQTIADIKAEEEMLNKYLAEIKEQESNFEDCKSADELDYLKGKVDPIFAKVNEIAAEIEISKKKIEEVKSRYAKLKSDIKAAQNEYKEEIVKFNELKESRQKEYTDIQNEMKAMTPEIDKEILAIYETKKKDIQLPVIVEINGNTCTGCGMELPGGLISDLKEKKYIICSECGRIIYKKD